MRKPSLTGAGKTGVARSSWLRRPRCSSRATGQGRPPAKRSTNGFTQCRLNARMPFHIGAFCPRDAALPVRTNAIAAMRSAQTTFDRHGRHVPGRGNDMSSLAISELFREAPQLVKGSSRRQMDTNPSRCRWRGCEQKSQQLVRKIVLSSRAEYWGDEDRYIGRSAVCSGRQERNAGVTGGRFFSQTDDE